MVINGEYMNYEKIYNQIIERAKSRNLDGYSEKHHIIPKCMNGTNNPDNIVKLTAREHFLCHWLLHEMYPNNTDLRYSFWSMCRSSDNQKRYRPSSRIYEYAKHQMLQVWQKFKPSENQINSIKESLTGTKWYHKLDGSNLRAFPDDEKIELEGWLNGRFNGHNISTKANSDKQKKYKGKKLPTTSNKRCSIDGVEFESAKEAADYFNINECTMRDRLLNRFRSEKFKERYKNWYYIN
jgi:hypothetical protein